jgi:hypothetical protein
MTHKVTIDGREVDIAWNQGTARRLGFRAAKHGVELDGKALFDPKRAAAAYVETLWLMLPPEEFSRHATPEDLASVIDHETESPAIVSAVLNAIGEMMADDEKKTPSANTPSPASNLVSVPANGTTSTRKRPKQLPKHGKSARSG